MCQVYSLQKDGAVSKRHFPSASRCDWVKNVTVNDLKMGWTPPPAPAPAKTSQGQNKLNLTYFTLESGLRTWDRGEG